MIRNCGIDDVIDGAAVVGAVKGNGRRLGTLGDGNGEGDKGRGIN